MIGISTDQMFHQLQWARPGATWHTPAVPWSAWEFTSFPQTPPGLRRHETEDGFALKGALAVSDCRTRNHQDHDHTLRDWSWSLVAGH